jgi:hypothetical protein
VLARLEEEPGVIQAEVDRHGTLLRVHLVDASATAPVIARLQELGFFGQIMRNETSGGRWYGRDAVGELSAEEAGVIARRVVPKFTREHRLIDIESIVISLVTAALHQCFVTSVLDLGTPAHALDDSCGRAVRAATQAQLGDELASLLGRDIEADLAGHRASRDAP